MHTHILIILSSTNYFAKQKLHFIHNELSNQSIILHCLALLQSYLFIYLFIYLFMLQSFVRVIQFRDVKKQQYGRCVKNGNSVLDSLGIQSSPTVS